jgi:hypothetical protein
MTKRQTDSPGLLPVKRPRGTVDHYWSAPRASKRPEAKGFRPRLVRLHQSTAEGRAARCRELTAELHEWMATEAKTGRRPLHIDGTLESLNRHYESHPDSPFHDKDFATRRTYCGEAKLLLEAVGKRRVDKITGADLNHWHKQFAKPAQKGGQPRLRRAQGAMKALRRIVKWGAQNRLPGCAELRAILAFIAAAYEMGRPSMAMAAALMFDTSLRQTDVIGKWEPDDSGKGGYVHCGRRWTGGLLWQDIQQGVLSKRTTKTGARAVYEIAPELSPLVAAEMARVPEERRIGPVVVDEETGRPYRHRWFAALWRRIARKAGIPDEILSRDTRGGDHGSLRRRRSAGARAQDGDAFGPESDRPLQPRLGRADLDRGCPPGRLSCEGNEVGNQR